VKIIQRYVLREHAGPFFFAMSALTSLMLLNYITKQFGNLVGKGLPWSAIGEFFLLSIPFTVAMTLPMSVLVAVLYAFSRLAAENEITALKASGVGIARLILPPLGAGVVLTFVMIGFNDQLLPRANHRLRQLQTDIANKKPTFALREQVVNEVMASRIYMRVSRVERATNKLREVIIYDLSDPLRRRTIYADSGQMVLVGGSDLLLTLDNGYSQEVPAQNISQVQRLYFMRDFVRVRGVANQFQSSNTEGFKGDREMSVCELQSEVARAEIQFREAQTELRQARAALQIERKTGLAQYVEPPPQSSARLASSKRLTLGRVYCDVMGRMNVTAVAIKHWLTPNDLHAATLQAQDTVRRRSDSAKAQDTVRRRTDSAAAKAQDTTRRRADSTAAARIQDSLRQRAVDSIRAVQAQEAAKLRADSIAAVEAAKNPAIPRQDTAAITPVMPPGPTIPGAIAPSTGGAIPAQAALESARLRSEQFRQAMNQNEVEIHKKFAISVACIVFVLVGAPIAVRFPRGGVGLVIGFSLVIFAIYYIGLIAGESLADRGFMTPFWAMWAANIILTIVGLVLLARMGRVTATTRGGDIADLMETVRGLLRFGRKREVESA
jgi:lipopolysaccharide export system permease protein